MAADPNKKQHRHRKSQGAAEVWRKQKRARNEARPKQHWVGGSVEEGGHWERITADSKGN